MLFCAAMVYQLHSLQGKWDFSTVDSKVGAECSWSKYYLYLYWAVFETLPFFKQNPEEVLFHLDCWNVSLIQLF